MTGHSNWSSEIPMRAGPRPERRSIAELKLESERGGIFKPPGLRLDLGGIGKGYAVDKAAGILATARDFLIDAGGDVYAAGMAPGNEVWRIGIASPNQADVDLEAVELHEQAIATSTTATRRWR